MHWALETAKDLKWFFFSFKGRISRKSFWIYGVLLYWIIQIFISWVLDITITAFGVNPFRTEIFRKRFVEGHPFLAEPAHTKFIIALGITLAILYLYIILFIWTILAINTKRLHDRNRPGWLIVILYGGPLVLFRVWVTENISGVLSPLITTVTSIFFAIISVWLVIEMSFLKGAEGPNRFGDPDPLLKKI